MPFSTFYNEHTTISVWRLVALAILVILFRRLPVILVLYKWIPDIRTFREAVFSGHFGPSRHIFPSAAPFSDAFTTLSGRWGNFHCYPRSREIATAARPAREPNRSSEHVYRAYYFLHGHVFHSHS